MSLMKLYALPRGIYFLIPYSVPPSGQPLPSSEGAVLIQTYDAQTLN